jgi:hypothetical protein
MKNWIELQLSETTGEKGARLLVRKDSIFSVAERLSRKEVAVNVREAGGQVVFVVNSYDEILRWLLPKPPPAAPNGPDFSSLTQQQATLLWCGLKRQIQAVENDEEILDGEETIAECVKMCAELDRIIHPTGAKHGS